MDETGAKLEDGDEEEIGDEGPFPAEAVGNDTEDDLVGADLVRK